MNATGLLTAACSVLCRIREALTSEETAIERDTPENAKMVHRLNGFLVDFINLLWQKRLLHEDGDGVEGARAQFGLTSYVDTGLSESNVW